MVPLLDGNKDRIAIINRLEQYVTSGKITINENDIPLTDSKLIRIALEKTLEKTLGNLARSAILVK
jgi:methyltransferase-like protein